jgi:hypothetical protein
VVDVLWSTMHTKSMTMTRLKGDQAKRVVSREECSAGSKRRNSKPTQNWGCQLLHAEEYTIYIKRRWKEEYYVQ